MMKVTASQAISRLGARLGERRRRASQGERPPLTRDDEQNISEFTRIVDDTIQVLAIENDALKNGDVSRVADCFEAKSQLMKDLTLRQPVVEPFLREDMDEIAELKLRIRKLADSLEQNGILLQGMAAASRSIISEVENIRRRQSLDGVYDKTGQKRTGLGPSKSRFASKV